MKQLFGWLIVIVIITGGAYLLWGKDTDNGNGNIPTTYKDLIRVDSPAPNATVTSPFTVTGEARGNWYFEASFPVRLRDASGNELAVAIAQAQGEWMTEEYVPFTATLAFPNSNYNGPGTLVFEKDNASGLPEHDDSFSIPVTISSSGGSGMMSVEVFFGTDETGNTDCSLVEAVTREVPQTQAVAQAALTELLKGPTPAEEAAGATTSIPGGVAVQSLRVEDGTAYADFSSELDEEVAGSCRVTAIRSQIEETLMQFPTVDDVVISIDGETEEILQP